MVVLTPGAGGGGTHDPLARRAAATPDRTALVDATTGATWRYDDLDGAVSEDAGRLAALGLQPGDHLGLLADTSVDAARLVHAAWRRGLRLVPLHARLSRPEVSRRAERCDLDALLCTRDTAAAAADVACPVAVFARGDGEPERLGGDHVPLSTVDPAEPAPAAWDAGDVAAMPTTSGTTGEPNVVQLTMGNLFASASASADRLGVRPDDRWLLCLPVAHVGGLSPVVRCAHDGTGLVVVEGFDAAAVVRATREHAVTGISLVPTQLRRVLDADGSLADSVRTVLLGGAPAPSELLDRCRRLEVPVYPTYGLTEAASQVATATPAQAAAREGTVGRPLQSVDVTVVDADGEPLPPGERGEVVVAGPTVTPGYYGDDGATATAFGPRGLHTGDLGRLDGDGFLWVEARLDDVVVTGGENVPPGEVEAALRDYVGVADAAVVGVPDPEWGERVAALVVPEEDGPLDVEALLEHCRGRLAGFKVPKSVTLADGLPRTASGTVDRPAVRERLAE